MNEMPTFRASIYLTLAVACLVLGYAQYSMFPVVGVFAGIVVISLGAIYRLETRVQLLSIAAANRVGAGIAFLCAIWVGYQVLRESQTHTFGILGWPMFIVVLLAPVLMAAIPAKLLRREKHAGDYWQLHVAALAAVVLSGAMAETPITFAMMSIYGLLATWSLASFYRVRTGGLLPPAPGKKLPRSSGEVVEISTHYPRRFAATWLVVWLVAVVAAVPLYLFTPRSHAGKFDFGRQRIEIGYAADQMVDLNRTGELESNPEVAFQVLAEASDGSRKLDLDREQRWRGTSLIRYHHGTWQREVEVGGLAIDAPAHKTGPWNRPDLGPDQYNLRFTVPTKLHSYFLADPVAWEPDSFPSVADIIPNSPPKGWYTLPDGSFVRLPSASRLIGTSIGYIQFNRPPVEPGLSQPFRIVGDIPRTWIHNPLASVKKFADESLARAVKEGRLASEVSDPDPITLLPREQHHEKIAREFCRLLSESSEYVYTTNVRRSVPELDPIEDFLFHTKAGHCERFTTALILMLRSQGIPSVMILGFKGCHSLGDGQYEVLQESAHAWAEVLISRNAPRPNPNALANRQSNREWHRLTLDPSPLNVESSASKSGETESGLSSAWLRRAFNQYVVKYTPEQRDRALRDLGAFLGSFNFLIGLAIAAGLTVVLGVARRQLLRLTSKGSSSENPWLKPLLRILARAGFVATPDQTLREFAIRVELVLNSDPATAPFASVPSEWIEDYYRYRFGGAKIDEERKVELHQKLDRLEQALEVFRRRNP